jgi:cell division protein FtsB
MEEDIKNIEEVLEFKEDTIKYHAWVGTKFINSVENLLNAYIKIDKDYVELEEAYEKLEEENKQLNAKYEHEIYREKEFYIHKSVIQNKIQEYLEFDKAHKTFTRDGRENFTWEYFKALELQELLEERNK